MSKAAPFPESEVATALQSGVAALRLPESPGVELVEALTRYLAELHRWNAAYNLTAVRNPIDMVPRHILDALTVAPWIGGPRVADIGTGAGLPGIPLALLRPEQHFTLLDANGKKIRFVTHAVASLGLSNVTPVQSRTESFAAEPFTTIVCRAFTALPDFVAGTAHLLAPGGALVAMKGRYPEAEIATLPPGWELTECAAVTVPGLAAERHIAVLRRAG